MSVFNDARYVGEAIESVLAQTFRDFELVIVIDGSTDGSREIVCSFDDSRIRVIDDGRNAGQAQALNRGLAEIESEYVARLDADDVAYPERLERQVAWLDAHPDVAVVGTQAVPIDGSGRRIRRIDWWYAQWQRPMRGAAVEWYRMFDNPMIHSAVMFRRALAQSLGGYDGSHPMTEDSDLWMRIARQYRIENLDERLVAYRFHTDSLTASRRSDDGWQRYIDSKNYIVLSSMQDVLQCTVPERWASLWIAVNSAPIAVTARDVTELVQSIDACAARFFELHPHARHDAFIAGHHVTLLGRAVVKVLPRHRRTALRLMLRMFRRHPRTALRLFPRLAALGVRALLFARG